MKKEEIDKYCKKYSSIPNLIIIDSLYLPTSVIFASDLLKKIAELKKVNGLKDNQIGISIEEDSLEFRGERPRTRKEILVVIEELKEQEERQATHFNSLKKKAKDHELKEYKRLHKKYGKY